MFIYFLFLKRKKCICGAFQLDEAVPEKLLYIFFSLTFTNYFIILEKRYSKEHTKNPYAYVQARPDVKF